MIRDELSLVLFLAKHVCPSVNFALKQATVILKSDLGRKELYLGPGSWCYGPKFPDWSLISDQTGLSCGKLNNLLPGDAKLSAKWKPAMRSSPGNHRRPAAAAAAARNEVQDATTLLVWTRRGLTFRESKDFNGVEQYFETFAWRAEAGRTPDDAMDGGQSARTSYAKCTRA